MKVAPPSSMALGLMSLALLGLGCDSGPSPDVAADAARAVNAARAADAAEAEVAKLEAAKAGADQAVVDAGADKAGVDKADADADKAGVDKPTPATITAPPVPGAPGPAYFAVDKVGVVRLDGGKFTVLAESPSTLNKTLQVGGDGKVWISAYEGLSALQGDAFKLMVKAGYDDIGGTVDHFVVTADGQIWAATFKGVSHYDGKAWSTEEKATIGAGENMLQGIAVDPAGKVWVASTYKVHVRDGGAWKTIDLGKAGRGTLFFEDLELGPNGSVYALHSTALLHIGAAVDNVYPVEKVKLGRSALSYGMMALSTNLGLALVDIDVVTTVPTGGAPRSYNSRASAFLKSPRIDALSVDDSGRAWINTESGVLILGPGDAKTEWPSGSIPELTGEIRAILVVGAGPSQLPGAGAVRKGGLTGKLLRDGSPLANLPVEVCPSPSMIYSKTPCHDGAVKFAAKSDDSGVWTVSEVPIGTYGIAVKIDGKWQITFGHQLGDGMKEGQVYDTGSLTLDKK